jgi:hypothetical protein
MWYGALVSPDGKRLATMQLMQGKGLQVHPYVVDLTTSKSAPIGQPQDLKLFAWHPDGQSLFCEVREPDPESKYSKRFITSLSLDGRTRRIREGGGAVLLPKTKQFLFEMEHEKKRVWQTCNLEGGDDRQLGDGLAQFAFPTASGDGRLVMMKFEPGQAPQPHLVDLETGRATAIKVGPGLWSMPCW